MRSGHVLLCMLLHASELAQSACRCAERVTAGDSQAEMHATAESALSALDHQLTADGVHQQQAWFKALALFLEAVKAALSQVCCHVYAWHLCT